MHHRDSVTKPDYYYYYYNIIIIVNIVVFKLLWLGGEYSHFNHKFPYYVIDGILLMVLLFIII